MWQQYNGVHNQDCIHLGIKAFVLYFLTKTGDLNTLFFKTGMLQRMSSLGLLFLIVGSGIRLQAW